MMINFNIRTRCQKTGQQLIAQSDDLAISPAIALPCGSPVERPFAMTLVVFDMDGTLLDAQSKISPFTSDTLGVDDSSDHKGKLLRTSCGPIEAHRVVLATGPDPAAVKRFGGFDLPQRSTPGVIVVTRPVKPLLRGILVAPGIHIHQRVDGRLIIGEQEGAPDNAAHAARLADRPKRFPNDSVADQHAQRLLSTTRDYLPSIEETEVDEVIIGWRPLPVDGHPVIGPSPADDRVYVAIMHSGVSLAAITGDLVARELADGVEMALLQPFRANRVFDTKNRY